MYSSRQTKAKYMNYILQKLIYMKSESSQKQDVASTEYSHSQSLLQNSFKSQPSSSQKNLEQNDNLKKSQLVKQIKKVPSKLPKIQHNQQSQICQIEIQEYEFKYRNQRENRFSKLESNIHAQTFSYKQKLDELLILSRQQRKVKQQSVTMNADLKQAQVSLDNNKLLAASPKNNNIQTQIFIKGINSSNQSTEFLNQFKLAQNALTQQFQLINKNKNPLELKMSNFSPENSMPDVEQQHSEEDYFELSNNQSIHFTFFNQKRQYVKIWIKNEKFPMKFTMLSKIGQIFLFFDYTFPKPNEEKHDFYFQIKGNVSYMIPPSEKIEKNAEYVYLGIYSDSNCQASFKVWFEDECLAKYRLRQQMQEEKFKKLQSILQQEIRKPRQQDFDDQENYKFLSLNERINKIEQKRMNRKISLTKYQKKNFSLQNAKAISKYREQISSKRNLNSSREQEKSTKALKKKNINDISRLKYNMKKIIQKEVNQFYSKELVKK